VLLAQTGAPSWQQLAQTQRSLDKDAAATVLYAALDAAKAKYPIITSN